MKHIVVLGSMLIGLGGHAWAGVVVVAADSAASELDLQQVRRIFLGRESSVGEQPATVIYQADGKPRQDFEGKVLRKTSAEVTSLWAKLIFTGKARAPQEVADNAAVKAKVTATPGAIGYIDDDAVDETVKVLFRY